MIMMIFGINKIFSQNQWKKNSKDIEKYRFKLWHKIRSVRQFDKIHKPIKP